MWPPFFFGGGGGGGGGGHPYIWHTTVRHDWSGKENVLTQLFCALDPVLDCPSTGSVATVYNF